MDESWCPTASIMSIVPVVVIGLPPSCQKKKKNGCCEKGERCCFTAILPHLLNFPLPNYQDDSKTQWSYPEYFENAVLLQSFSEELSSLPVNSAVSCIDFYQESVDFQGFRQSQGSFVSEPVPGDVYERQGIIGLRKWSFLYLSKAKKVPIQVLWFEVNLVRIETLACVHKKSRSICAVANPKTASILSNLPFSFVHLWLGVRNMFSKHGLSFKNGCVNNRLKKEDGMTSIAWFCNAKVLLWNCMRGEQTLAHMQSSFIYWGKGIEGRKQRKKTCFPPETFMTCTFIRTPYTSKKEKAENREAWDKGWWESLLIVRFACW